MPGITTLTMFVTGAVGFIGATLVSLCTHADAFHRSTVGDERKIKRVGPVLLLALPFLVALGPEALGLNAGIPAGGRSVAVGSSPEEADTVEINCSAYCGWCRLGTRASSIVTPDR